MFLGDLVMLSLEELRRQADAFQRGALSLLEFQDWFEDNCPGAYEVEGLRQVCISIDTAFSEYYYDGIGEDGLRQEVFEATRHFVPVSSHVRPFDSARPETAKFVHGPPSISLYACGERKVYAPVIRK